MYEDEEEREVEIIQSMADKDTVVNEDLHYADDDMSNNQETTAQDQQNHHQPSQMIHQQNIEITNDGPFCITTQKKQNESDGNLKNTQKNFQTNFIEIKRIHKNIKIDSQNPCSV